MDKAIAEAIIMAQVASDAGKGIDDLALKLIDNARNRNAQRHGYNVKDLYILKALSHVNAAKNSDVRYFVTRDEHINSYLVYFDIRLNGRRMQVSFHSFNRKLKAYLGSKEPSHWDHKSSRNSCLYMAEYFKMTK